MSKAWTKCLFACFAIVWAFVPCAAHAETYTYDALGRLSSVTTDDLRTITYAYDAAGNRTQVGIAALAPVVSAASLTVAYNTSGTVTLTPTGSYTSMAVTTPLHGTASINSSTAVATYTPTSGYYGSDSFSYTATGTGGTSAAATVSVTVSTPPAPTAGNVSLTTPYNTAGSVTLAAGGVFTSAAVVTSPGHGSVSIAGSTATFTPTAGYYGADSFTYNVTGPGGTSAAATVSVTVSLPAAPTVSAKSLTVAYNTAGSVALSPGGVYSLLSVVTAASHGTASISGTTATYTPTAGYYGADSFSYKATGPGGDSAPATVSVTVNTPSAPTAGNVSLTTAYNTAGSAALSPGGVYSSLAVVASPSHGSASISGTTATYTPTAGYYGSDSFTYNVTGAGGTSAAATVSVTVSNPPAPTVGNVSLTTSYNTAGSVGLSASGVYSSLAVVAAPSHGSASISGSTATYTPTAGYYGADSFTYNATGPGGTSASATVSITVSNPPAPIVTNGSITTAYNTAGSTTLSGSGVISSYGVGAAGHGTVSLAGSTATYSPNSGYYGSDSFTFTATGPGGTSNTGTINVSVGNPPAPTVTNGSISTAYNTAGSTTLSGSGVISSYAVSTAGHGTVALAGSTATYTPTSGYSGADSFTFTATGPGGTSNTGTISVTVAAPASPLAAALSTTLVQVNTAPAATSGTTPTATVTASGGSGSGYTYLWQWVSGDTTIAPTNTNGATTAWTRTLPGLSILYEAIWRCKVTDSAGTVVYSGNVTVDLTRGPSP